MPLKNIISVAENLRKSRFYGIFRPMDEQANTKETRIKPDLPGGFRDAAPEDAIAKEEIIQTVKTVFERFGFDPMQTSSVERTEVLTGGETTSSKIIFNVRGSEEETSDTSLRFDLTVPLARFLAANTDIPKPFKRYQIGKVWRGERQQAGRYREFIQADIDIIGVKSLDADAEVVQVMAETMAALGIQNYVIKVNFRDGALALLDRFGVAKENQMATLIAVDKKEKLEPKEWELEIEKASGLGEQTKDYITQILGQPADDSPFRYLSQRLEQLGVDMSKIEYDASLMRGLGYYTGTVFETVLTDLPKFGSVFSGGRFDGLTARFSTQALPAVGASIGVDRLFAALEELGTVQKKQTLTQALILNLDQQFAETYAKWARLLRAAGVNTAVYLGDEKAFQTQLAYAVKKEIPLVLIFGEKEKTDGTIQVKDLRSGEQATVTEEDIVTFITGKLGKQ